NRFRFANALCPQSRRPAGKFSCRGICGLAEQTHHAGGVITKTVVAHLTWKISDGAVYQEIRPNGLRLIARVYIVKAGQNYCRVGNRFSQPLLEDLQVRDIVNNSGSVSLKPA